MALAAAPCPVRAPTCTGQRKQQQQGWQQHRLAWPGLHVCRSAPKRERIVVEKPAGSWGAAKRPASRPRPAYDPWGLYEWESYNTKWDVPWGIGRTIVGLAIWAATFLGVGFYIVPLACDHAGIDLSDMSAQSRAALTLVDQMVETVASLLAIYLVVAQPLRKTPQESKEDLFVYDPSKPFTGEKGWASWALRGTLAAPFMMAGIVAAMNVAGYDNLVSDHHGTTDHIAAMVQMDLPTYLNLVTVTGFLAPLLEETVFRGFLLTSLTKYMPTWAAVMTSATAFGAAHMAPKDLPVLIGLGTLLGFSYVRSRNLLTPIVIHGLWNSGVLTLLFGLLAAGVDVQDLLKQGL